MCEIKDELKAIDEMLHRWGAWARNDGLSKLGYQPQSPEASQIASIIDVSDKIYPLDDEHAEKIDHIVSRMKQGTAHHRKIAKIFELRYVRGWSFEKIRKHKDVRESDTRTRELRNEGLAIVGFWAGLRDFSDDRF